MLRTIVLICKLGTDPSACTAETAIDLVAFPPIRAAMCGLPAQATIAGTALKPGPGEFVKIICERDREGRR